ncbi:HNH endonuclease signature motif containing protein [Luteipulveratus sp. YIM 133132]|uniref:HNH endonuclease signature motif containing protein n=1 Tax=Luteipulveratus flavus TaxID=3031728 RepID=UPI0023AFA6FB|nr:HNH endonuclease signature motif containing protein [Luteipulveratus sp. YIM 133132]MDE9366656.1 HNH endonuclease signature motif containing protein [Luteipulveratus sp. YIM 133132]
MAAEHPTSSGAAPRGAAPESSLPTVPSAAPALVPGAADGARILAECHRATEAVYRLAQVDRPALRAADLMAQIEATQALVNAAMAVQAVRIAQYAATEQHVDPRTEATREVAHQLGHAAEFADVDLAPVMAWGPRQATARVEEAIDAVTKVPRLVDRMAAGVIDAARVERVTRELIEAPDAVCSDVELTLLEAGVEGWSSRQVQARTRRLVQRLDHAAARSARHRHAVDRVGVFVQPAAEVGLSEWTAVLPTEQAAAAYASVDALAHELHAGTTTGKTLGQCRADAMTDLILQRAQVTTTMTVSVPVVSPRHASDRPVVPISFEVDPADVPQSWMSDLSDDDWDAALAELVARDPGDPPDPPPDDPWWDELEETAQRFRELGESVRTEVASDWATPPHVPSVAVGDAEVAGVGVIPASTVVGLLRDVDVAVVRVLVDSAAGVLRETSTRSYRPHAAMRRLVVERDEHCRFPGCSHPGRWCEADHVVPWPVGTTTATNLQLLCKHHHRAKHEAGWQVRMTPEGTCTWTSPHGREYVTRPDLVAHTVVGRRLCAAA